MADMKHNEIFELREMYYDNPDRKPAPFIGRFRLVEQIFDDFFNEDFIAENVDDGKLYYCSGREVCGIGGGVRYKVKALEQVKEI